MKTSLDNVLAIVLGGGVDSWLYPLTKTRSKPAVSLCGKYRLIDIPLSNCINSGIYHVAVMTQFNSVSLHRHISETYNFDFFHHGWVQIWAADQTNTTCETRAISLTGSSNWRKINKDGIRPSTRWLVTASSQAKI